MVIVQAVPISFWTRMSDWMGTLDAALRLVMHTRQGVDGTLGGTMENLDLGRMDMPIDVVMFGKSKLRFEALTIDGSTRELSDVP